MCVTYEADAAVGDTMPRPLHCRGGGVELLDKDPGSDGLGVSCSSDRHNYTLN